MLALRMLEHNWYLHIYDTQEFVLTCVRLAVCGYHQ